jgi:hypothetical protein
MTTNGATRTAETLKKEKDKETNDMDQAVKEQLLITKRMQPIWEELRSTISQLAADLTDKETILREHKVDPGNNQLLISFPSKRRDFALTFDPPTLGGYFIQYKVFGNRSPKIGQPEYEGVFNFVTEAGKVLLADAEGCNRNTAEAAEYLLDILVWGQRKDS